MNFFPSKKQAVRLFRFFLTLAALPLAFSACNDDLSTIGSSLVTDQSEVVIDSVFTVSGKSVPTGALRARSLSQLIGSIQARHYGSLSSEYVSQLMPSAEFDTTGVSPEMVDSIALMLRFYSHRITGDSMTPMGVNIFSLTRQLPDVLTSSFDPEGYYDPSKPVTSAVYSSNLLYSDSLEKIDVHVIDAKLPVEIGREFVRTYRANPDLFKSPTQFADLFPGIYVANSFGSGRVTNIFNTRVVLYYRAHSTYSTSSGDRDTIISKTDIIAASTPEVLTNNNLRFSIDPELKALAEREPVIVAPLGYDTQLTLPITKVIDSFRKGTTSSMGVVNSLSLVIPAEKIANDYGIDPPSSLLLVPTKDKDKFFDEQMIPDNVTTFIADYNSSSGNYIFSGLRGYMMHIMDGELDSSKIDELSTFTLVPVEIATESYTNSSYQTVTVITAVGPYIEAPAMTRLKLDEAKLKLTYSTETINF